MNCCNHLFDVNTSDCIALYQRNCSYFKSIFPVFCLNTKLKVFLMNLQMRNTFTHTRLPLLHKHGRQSHCVEPR